MGGPQGFGGFEETPNFGVFETAGKREAAPERPAGAGLAVTAVSKKRGISAFSKQPKNGRLPRGGRRERGWGLRRPRQTASIARLTKPPDFPAPQPPAILVARRPSTLRRRIFATFGGGPRGLLEYGGGEARES